MSEELHQLCATALPYLQQLTITHLESFSTNDGSTCLSSLRIVKVQFINPEMYQTILSSCPNLCTFQFSMFTSEESSLVIESHNNLRRLTINVGDVIWPWNDRIFDKYFICTPHLERLSIHRLFYISRAIESFHDYDWLVTVVNKRLKQLRLLNFHLRTFPSKLGNKFQTEQLLEQVKENFTKAHHDRYESHLIFEYV
ncbi:unnamed protein product [Adineta ricciae]|uniref:Uncharacterized protein n=1 Tax=Adineta ricciae TaxID=249248 RepID=A0A813P379_ADIRI|nr:unnamed protein product [Adineta ricciae]CAF0744728.1 unnamed protein product [Adineta ricciae]